MIADISKCKPLSSESAVSTFPCICIVPVFQMLQFLSEYLAYPFGSLQTWIKAHRRPFMGCSTLLSCNCTNCFRTEKTFQ